jgi:hypothetical protein
MHPALMYDFARAKIDDEQRAADRRRLAKKVAAESRTRRDGGSSIVARVWTLITGVGPAEPALSGSAG